MCYYNRTDKLYIGGVMETYSQFLDRINSFEKKTLCLGDGNFAVNPSLVQKVSEANEFKPFYGDTVVFALDDSLKQKLFECVRTLYSEAPQCFCEMLAPHFFHVTLHDLSNSPRLKDIGEETFDNEIKVLKAFYNMYKYAGDKIKMKSKCIFNMVNTSLVMGLYPTDEGEYLKLNRLYYFFDEIKKLGYPFTPHITLAYYNVNGFDSAAARLLEKTVNKLNEQEIELELYAEKLYYQKFLDMNNYLDVISLGEYNTRR